MTDLSNLQYLTVAQAAELLQCSPATVRRAIKRGQLPTLSFGATVRIARSALDRAAREAAADSVEPAKAG